MKKITCLLLLFAFHFSFGQSIFDNPITGTNPNTDDPYTTGQNPDPNITVSGIGRGTGIAGRNANDRYNAINWDSSVFDSNDYFEFTLTPNAGYEIDLVSFVYTGQASGTGPNNFAFRSSLDSYTTNIGSPSAGGSTIDLSSPVYQNISSAITFRIYGWGASSSIGTFSINDFTFNGVVSASPCSTTVTWASGGWTPSAPTSSDIAVIDDSYNTSINGNIDACRLIVNSGVLTVADNTYIEIQNDIVVNTGTTINVETQGAVVQIDDTGFVQNNGTITVTKETSLLNAWYEYTYWSSPVANETIGSALSESEPTRRFWFDASNFEDSTMETNNNNATVPGQDDIDDNNDDWQYATGATAMQPGVGYAATHSETFFTGPPMSSPPYQFDYIFTGPFNNGVITVPIYRNDSELNDYNWNFIGNPYPSAIHANAFLAANSNIATNVSTPKSINGAIFLWSQNTAPSSTTNGNQQLNFSNDDYAIINAVGENAGGDGITPSRFIPSGQGFFVAMSNAAPATLVSGNVYTTDVTFNNSMRVRGASDNSQFFKGTNSKGKTNTEIANKLWINLTSDNGVFNQILMGYVNGATKTDDGISYDTYKYPTNGAALYSTIENSEKKFAIQGKAPSDLNESETINLGFKTTIDVATLYTLSIAQIQGDFLNSTHIYLKDNLLDKLHCLSTSDYTFTSDVGEFNNRFQIVFNNNALSTNDLDLEKNKLSIIELEDNKVTFKTNSDSNIKSVLVYDLLGRQLYNFKGNNSSETYELSNLKNTVYVAKVELSNGVTVTKKAIKK